MSDPSPALRALARRLVQEETGGSTDRAALSAGLERACEKLGDELSEMLGAGGYQALLRRALNLARRNRTLLASVSLHPEQDNCFTGLTEALEAGPDEEAIATVAAVLENLLALLVTFLGEELGTQPVRRIWQDAQTSLGETNE